MSDQGNITKAGLALIQYILNFFKPDLPKIILFAFFSSLFLIVKNQVFQLPAGQSCPLSAMNTTFTGLPFSFYSYDRLQNSNFQPLHLFLNLLYYYIAACVLATFVCFGVKSIRENNKTARLIFIASSINIAVVIFVSIKIMAPDWLVKSVRNQQSIVANTLMFLGTSPDSISFKHRYYSLHEAVKHDNAALTNLLIRYGASINRHDTKGQTALHIAVSRNAIDASRELLRSGANPNVRNQNGQTPAHFACSLAMAKLLYLHKVNPNIIDKNYKRAEDMAVNPAVKEYWASKSTAKTALAIKQQIAAIKKSQAPAVDRSKPTSPIKKPGLIDIIARKLPGCTHSLGGSLFANGQEYSIKISASGSIIAYSGMHGFAYAKCSKKGYYHILVQIKGQKPRIYKNLFHESGDSEPLSVTEKQTVLIHLSVATSQAKIYWYFSQRKIKNLMASIKKDGSLEIGVNKLKVIAVRKSK